VSANATGLIESAGDPTHRKVSGKNGHGAIRRQNQSKLSLTVNWMSVDHPSSTIPTLYGGGKYLLKLDWCRVHIYYISKRHNYTPHSISTSAWIYWLLGAYVIHWGFSWTRCSWQILAKPTCSQRYHASFSQEKCPTHLLAPARQSVHKHYQAPPCYHISERRILVSVIDYGLNALFCVLNRTNCVLMVSVMWVGCMLCP
jgi:hypothetical protein